MKPVVPGRGVRLIPEPADGREPAGRWLGRCRGVQEGGLPRGAGAVGEELLEFTLQVWWESQAQTPQSQGR